MLEAVTVGGSGSLAGLIQPFAWVSTRREMGLVNRALEAPVPELSSTLINDAFQRR